MKPNIGFLDSIVRIALSMILIGAGLSYEAWWGFLGLCPLVTYFFRWSILYYFFGISTVEHEKKSFKNNANVLD